MISDGRKDPRLESDMISGWRWTGANGDGHDLRLEVDRIWEKGKT